MKKMRAISIILAVIIAVSCLAGCNSGGNYIATYNGQKIFVKLFDFFAQFNKDQYVTQYGYAAEPVDESEYMTLKHILVSFEKDDGTTRTEEEALAEAERIKAMITADNFDALMAEHSEDPGSKTNPKGYTFAHNDGSMMQEFDDGGWALEINQVSEPVKTSHGYHIIKRVELDKDALPRPIDWEEEVPVSENETMSHLDIVKEQAYNMTVRYAILSDIAKDNKASLSDEEYEKAKTEVYGIIGDEEAASKFFESINYNEAEIKELVEIITLADEYVASYVKEVNCEALFDEFIASDYYKEMKEYYTQMGMEIDYTEYDAENSGMTSAIQGYAFNSMYDAEVSKVVKNEEAYNQYK